MGFQNLSKPKRSLGQNFFTNANLAKFLVEKTLENKPSKVIEIGAGQGFFTKNFLEKGIEVVAIEKDNILSKNLQFIFPNTEVYNEDIFSKKLIHIFQKTNNTVCFGSLPYNVSKKIISYLATNSNIENFYFIIQKEVAEKYASEKKSSILSITTKLYFDSKILHSISRENFKPKPNVTSCFIKFSRNMNIYSVDDIGKFLEYLHIVFKQPRKTLKNNLQKYYNLSLIEKSFLKNRAEDLNFNEHVKLWSKLVI